MKHTPKFYILFFCMLLSCSKSFDHPVSNKTELNRSFEPEIRGIKNNGIIYYIENDLQTLSAYENNKLKWKTNIIAVCGKPKVGASEIRGLKLKSGKILVVFGKHSFAEVDITNGKIQYLGAD